MRAGGKREKGLLGPAGGAVGILEEGWKGWALNFSGGVRGVGTKGGEGGVSSAYIGVGNRRSEVRLDWIGLKRWSKEKKNLGKVN